MSNKRVDSLLEYLQEKRKNSIQKSLEANEELKLQKAENQLLKQQV